jgi:hypothetical protein
MMIGVDIRTLLFNVRVASCASQKWTNPNYASGAYADQLLPPSTLYV